MMAGEQFASPVVQTLASLSREQHTHWTVEAKLRLRALSSLCEEGSGPSAQMQVDMRLFLGLR
jgi:hypothetical protein